LNEGYRYLTLAVSPEWRRADAPRRRADKREFAAAGRATGVSVHAFSLVGTRADADLLLWAGGDDLEALRALATRLAATRLWTYSSRPYAWPAARVGVSARAAARLRDAAASRERERETPIFAGRALPLEQPLDEIDGVAAAVASA